ncbi:hypothetical protein BEP19_15680 [Ammoniphilus oxalaticus]|uniref:Terminase n=1 Tax=Ammoniphilus oxalaticus TaxID=66863 RepID=A0A419SE03_9BACL|nr:hypothetical protein [Ammoniphilus oxalaticus]RKD21113.1 hypothetical protein BEP19_15680 [Ammoniphilus oxalaticus]
MSGKNVTEKEKRIDKEKKRLKSITSELSKEKQEVADGLIDEIAFMRATLENLKAEINENGEVDIMPQGEYSIRRQSPELQSYNTMIQRYTTACKTLFDLLPDEVVVESSDDFENF